MTELLEEFILIAPKMELEETPMEGTSPEAPGGRDYDREKGEDIPGVVEENPEEIEDAPHDRDHIGQYEFPKDDDSMI